MNVRKAQLPQLSQNQSLTILNKIRLNNDTEFIGWRIDTTKQVPNKKDNDTHSEIDESVSPIYDETTQQIIKKQQLQNNITDLQKMLAQSTASNAKANVDVENLKKQNAELAQQIAKMQIQNKKG